MNRTKFLRQPNFITLQDLVYVGAEIEKIKELERSNSCVISEYRITKNLDIFHVRVVEYKTLKIVLSGTPFKIVSEIVDDKINTLSAVIKEQSTDEEKKKADYYAAETLIASKVVNLTRFRLICGLMMTVSIILAFLLKDYSFLLLTAAAPFGMAYVSKRKQFLLNQTL